MSMSNPMKGLYFLVISIQLCSCSCMQGVQSENNCSVAPPMGRDDVQVRFPFRLSDQPKSCGYQGFELSHSYQGNFTMLKLPSSQSLAVSSIFYPAQVLSVYDPDGCLSRTLFHLNLSASPFRLCDQNSCNQYYIDYSYDNNNNNSYFLNHFYTPFTLVNCSSKASGTYESYFNPAPCLSNLPGYYYLVDSDLPVGEPSSFSCQVLTEDTFLVSDDKQNLVLVWDEPDCRHCTGGDCRLNTTSKEIECAGESFLYEAEPYDPGTHKVSHVRNVIIGLGLAAFVAVAAITIPLVYKMLDKTKKKKQNLKIETFLKEYKSMKPTRYSSSELKKMTENFKTKLGQGGYGNVFKGKLPNAVPVAAKVLDNPTVSEQQFTNEIGTIGRIHHVNIVRLLGFCVEGSTRALIYEFMPNESLDKHIFMEEGRSMTFSWAKLHDISMGIARGIEYLHQGCDQRILHFDIKPQNILLDQEFNPKISDFGLAKLCSKEKSAVSMTAVRGTMGYIAPEVFLGNNRTVSHKSDVYGFGMLLLEMVGGMKNIDEDVENSSQLYFPELIYNQLKQGEELSLVTGSPDDAEIAKKLAIIALWCAQWKPADRPSMKVVVQMLEGGPESLPLPSNPFASHVGKKNVGCADTMVEVVIEDQEDVI